MKRPSKKRKRDIAGTPSVTSMPPCSKFRREQLFQEERALRTQITVAETQLVVVYSRLNDLAPSVALPTEVLVLIFRMLSPGKGPFPLHDNVYLCVPITAVSHVCHRWRAITLAYSALWTHVPPLLLGYEWTREMLSRTQGAPLTLDIQLGSHKRDADASLKLALKQLDQIRTLIVPCSGQYGLQYVSSPAPLLESISFNNLTGIHTSNPIQYHHIVRFETPALRKLVLGNNVTLDGTNATIIKDLTHLDIGNTDMPRLYKTIDVLQALLSLKFLALNIRASSAAVSFTIITLPSLTSIMLNGTALDCSKLLQQVRAPSVKACTLVCTSRDKTELPDLLAAVSALLAQNKEISALLQRPHRLFINMGELSSRKMTVRMAETEYCGGIEAFCQPKNVTWNPNWHMALSYTASLYGSITLNKIASVCKVLCLDGVTDATLQRISGSGVSLFCKEFIGKMPALRSLTVCRTLASAIFKAIQPSKSFRLEGLSQLCFEGLVFKQNRSRFGRNQDITELKRVFRTRGKMGLNLPRLKLIQCTSPGGDLNNLRSAVIRMGVNYTEMDQSDTGG
ncbi:hypothetical protein K503DRAFT_159501 [Rhizopogon vinicolor AM-OR11-026]|uniref:F-box domain-containing protein n=1 Tax=Rhizopogon vinicolor AM-OR11-026 TaxID=1314800 RepID=A0A1B7N0U3_9AGAM|nr:hypothetical protein K503DRAFT_159501 [Rhizopogon vinicolor AM-OR11-026]